MVEMNIHGMFRVFRVHTTLSNFLKVFVLRIYQISEISRRNSRISFFAHAYLKYQEEIPVFLISDMHVRNKKYANFLFISR